LVASYPSVEELESMANDKLKKISKDLKQQYGVKSNYTITAGHVHDEIVNYSKANNIDLITMGTHGASGLIEVFIGSNSQRVVTLSEVPVLTMQKKSNKEGFKNILIPINDSTHSREKVNVAMVFAKLYDAKIHITGLSESKDKEALRELKIKIASVEYIVKTAKLKYITTYIYGDSLAESALKYATKNKCDLIAINTGHESKITGQFLGLFAQQIVNHSKIPVLSVKTTKDSLIISAPGYGIS
jgi:nucleotide-binding universal stress UspA family protein